jgi:hypothetical protein
LVVGDEVKFIRVYYMECWSSDGFGVVWESFYGASVGEVDLGFLGFESDAGWKAAGEGCYACYDSFGLAPRRPRYANCAVRMS